MRRWLNCESYQGCGIEPLHLLRLASLLAIRRLMLATLLAAPFVNVANGQINILTSRYDNLRTASNLNETVLNASNVNPSQFGKLYSYPVDGTVFAQPLYVQGLTINGAVHNVLLVATMNDKVYAFDADSNSPPLWSRDFTNGTTITPVPLTDINANPFIVGNMGVEGTPVIDLTTKTIYLLVRTKESGAYVYRLRALDITTGQDRAGSPTPPITASVAGTAPDAVAGMISFDPKMQQQRTGLALTNGVVLVAWASHGDLTPYHGWIMGFDATSLTQVGVFLTTPDNYAGGIWQSGHAPAIDSAGNAYFVTGNGPWDGTRSFGDSILKLSVARTGLSLLDYFTPSNQQLLSSNDQDLGSIGVTLLPNTNLLLGGGKEGVIYLVNANNLGHQVAGDTQIVQRFPANGTRMFGGFAYWSSSVTGPLVYNWASTGVLESYHFNGTTLDTPAFRQGSLVSPGLPGGCLAVSANGNVSGTGILWASMSTSQDAELGLHPGILRAFNAETLQEIWNSEQNATRDRVGTLQKFVSPVVANGKLFIPNSDNAVNVFGLQPTNPDFAISVSPATKVAPSVSQAVYTVNVGALNGFAGTIALAVSGMPSGVTATFTPATLNGSGTSTLQFASTTAVPLGSYTLTITSTSGILSHSASAALTLSLIGTDQQLSADSTTANGTITTAPFSTRSANELLLAFIATDYISGPNTTVTSVTGGGLTWVPVVRANQQSGTSEIWRAYSPTLLTSVSVTATLSQSVVSSMTVMTFAGVDTSGTNGSGAIGVATTASAPSGAPVASLTATRNGSWVFGVGNDFDNAIARTPGTGQSLVHQTLSPVGDTYWVQMRNGPTALSGTNVTIDDTAPIGDRYNLAIVEILPAPGTGAPTYSISGTINPAANGSGATVTLSQNGTNIATTSADNTGSYTFSSLTNGNYVVTPNKAGFTMSPTSQPAAVNGGNVTVPNFTATVVTWSISGTITPAASGSGATVTLTQGATTIATVTADPSGNYAFTGQANGTYALTPSKTGFTFSPTSQPATVSGGNVTVPNFTATAVPTWTISGTITPAASGSGALVTLSGTASETTTADSSGNYSFAGLTNGRYAVTPSKPGFAFSPTSQSVTVNGMNATVPNFTATTVSTWTISGTIAGGGGTTVTLAQSGTTIGTAIADSSGNYNFANIVNGAYTVTPSRTGLTFSPTIQSVTINGANAPNVNFTATDVSTFKFPDLSDIIPTGAIAVVQTPTGKQFQYTHDTYNGGPGPLVIQPAYNPATGNYQGTQYIYTQSPSGTWSLTQQIPVAGNFFYHAIHGHFHFPFASYGIYNVGPGGGPGTLVVPSAKNGFCIHDSFIYNPALPNAGALGNLGSCSDPSSIQGLNIGAVDEYDKNDFGQSISIDGLPDGTYWLRTVVDPNNFFAEADKTNNETDVKFTLSGTNVQVLQTVVPVLAQPPAISITSPSAGSTVMGIVQFTASSATTSGVQYLVDGEPFGSVVTGAPYTLSWDSSTVVNGTHWLAAQTTGPTGVIGTSPVVAVTVSNNGPTIPAVQVTSPANGSIVSAITTLYATVASSQAIANVNFLVDNLLVGSPVTSLPYSILWDTTTATAGTHGITATATDIAGNVGTSAPVTVTVDNTHPAKLIGKDVQISVDGWSTLTTAPFSTTTPGDLLVAFVAYDGLLTSPQTATVTGAGLTWTLLIRSNTQAGTSEIWSARATGTLSSVTVSSQVGSGFRGSLTVVAFTNTAGTSVVARTGAPTGAPDIPLPGVIAGDWVFAVGNDWDNAIARVPVSGQVLVHQQIDTVVGDTYWVQSTAAPSTANALVDIHDTAPTTDRWNYAAVEIVAAH